MLQVLPDFNILTTVKCYDEFLRKVEIDHYVCNIGLHKKYNNLKRYDRHENASHERRENAVCAP